jgi:hypothetical protein
MSSLVSNNVQLSPLLLQFCNWYFEFRIFLTYYYITLLYPITVAYLRISVLWIETHSHFIQFLTLIFSFYFSFGDVPLEFHFGM